MEKLARIVVLGGGIEGLSLLEYLRWHGFENVTLLDENEAWDGDKNLAARVILGPEVFKSLAEYDVVFKSPGIRLSKLGMVKGVLRSTTEFFFERKKGLVIGVTGTKGKGTTSTLIYNMLLEGGLDVYLGGNIGYSPLSFVDQLTEKSVTVLEMSSFQLQDMKMSPNVSVMLNVTEDHLDFHADVEEYRAAKRAIFEFQNEGDLAILNADYPVLKEFYGDLGKGKKVWVSMKGAEANGHPTEWEVSGSSLVGGMGAWIEWKNEVEGVIYVQIDGTKEEIVQVSDVALLGKYMLENVLPAIFVARHLGMANEIIAKVLREFKGLPHRLELVRELKGRKFYNDSFSTGPVTSVAACSAFREPIALIAGGSDKGLQYDEWAAALWENPAVRVVVLIGQIAPQLEESLKKAAAVSPEHPAMRIFHASAFEEAIRLAYDGIPDGGVVLLSPASASFGMFKNYKERGERFRAIVGRMV